MNGHSADPEIAYVIDWWIHRWMNKSSINLQSAVKWHINVVLYKLIITNLVVKNTL